MFRIVFDPSSGSIKLYLAEIRSCSLMFVLCLVGVWQRNFEPLVFEREHCATCLKVAGLTPDGITRVFH